MGVKPGYKRTEVGVIPEEWEVKPMGELGQVRTGPFGTLLKADEYAGTDGVPLVSVGEIGEGSFRVTDKTPRVPAKVVRRLPQYVLKTGDIVFGRKGAVDRSALVGPSQHGWFLGSDGISLRLNEACNPSYVAWQFQRPELRAWLIQNAVGTTMASLNQKVLAGVTVPWAPRTERRAIATALSDVDALLTQLDRLIAKKRDIKQAAMQQLLTGKTRLPGFGGEWVTRTVGELGTTYGGLVGKSKADFGAGDAQYVTFLNVMGNSVVSPALFDRVRVPNGEQQNLVRQGDLLFNGSSETPEEVGMCALVACEVPDLYLNSFCFGLRLRDEAKVDGLFLTYLIRGEPGRDMMKSLAQGSTRYNISKAALRAAAVSIPDLQEQTAIATLLSDLDAELAALEARRDKTRALKQGMMQALLTGRTRLV